MIRRWLFDERKTIAINLPSSNKNEHFSKKFCEKLEVYANGKVKFNTYLKLKITLNIFSCIVYHGICSCGNNYISETIRNVVTRTGEQEQPNGKSEPSKHLKNNPRHQFNWMILS